MSLACKAATDNTHDEGFCQHILQLGPRDSFVPTAHSPSGCQIKLDHSMPDMCQGCRSVGCAGQQGNKRKDLSGD